MKRIIYSVLATVTGLVLLFSYRTSLDAVQPAASTDTPARSTTSSGTSGSAMSSGSGSAGTGSSSSSGSGTAAGASGSSSGLRDGSYTGQAVDTRYGAVQVQITVSAGRITDVSVPQYPNTERRDQQINAQAIPVLIEETKSAQSAQIDMVSGATFTSDGYQQSLQSALDQARA